MLRLRQVCIVAPTLTPATQLAGICDVPICHRDPLVNQFGLENAILAFGPTFVEFVAPITEGTAASRFLVKHPEGGGYMVILDCDELPAMRAHVEALGIRIIHASDMHRDAAKYPPGSMLAKAAEDYGGFSNVQLHPRDTGGTMLEFNWTEGGESIDGAYGPAGPNWQSFARVTSRYRVIAAELQSPSPQALAEKWSAILRRPVQTLKTHIAIELDSGEIHFTQGEREALTAISVQVPDGEKCLAAASKCGFSTRANGFVMSGIRVDLRAPTPNS